jgi:hypothetical protein
MKIRLRSWKLDIKCENKANLANCTEAWTELGNSGTMSNNQGGTLLVICKCASSSWVAMQAAINSEP